MITKFECTKCDNKNIAEVIMYDGLLGYEAVICKKCGSYFDQNGVNEADDWSNTQINNN